MTTIVFVGPTLPAAEARRLLPKGTGDVLVRQAVNAVAPNAFGLVLARRREPLGDSEHGVVECGVETRELGQAGPQRHQHADRRQGGLLVQRCQRRQRMQLLDDVGRK